MPTINPPFNQWVKLIDGTGDVVNVKKTEPWDVMYRVQADLPSPSNNGLVFDELTYYPIEVLTGTALYIKACSENQIINYYIGGGGGGLTPAQETQLDQSGKYQAGFSDTVAFTQGQTSFDDGVLWEKLTNSAASAIKPAEDLVNWKYVSGEQQVTAIPPQPVNVNSPVFIFDTVNTKRYRLNLAAAGGAIYVPADGSVTAPSTPVILTATTQTPAPAGMTQLTATANPNEWEFPAGITYVAESLDVTYRGASFFNGVGIVETAPNLITFNNPNPDAANPARVKYVQV